MLANALSKVEEEIPEELELKWDPGEIEYPPTMQEEQAMFIHWESPLRPYTERLLILSNS